jgi:hypothetical protein
MDELKYIKQLVREWIDFDSADNSLMTDEQFQLALMRNTDVINELKELVDAE